MNKIFLYFVLLSGFVLAQAEDSSFYDYDSNEFESYKEADSDDINSLFNDKKDVEDDYQIEDNRSASEDDDQLDYDEAIDKGGDEDAELPQPQDAFYDNVANAEEIESKNKESLGENPDDLKNKKTISSEQFEQDQTNDEIEKLIEISDSVKNENEQVFSFDRELIDPQSIKNIENGENLGHDENVNAEELEEEIELSQESRLEDLDLQNIMVEKSKSLDSINKEPQIEEVVQDGDMDEEKENPDSNYESKEISFDVNKDLDPLPLPPVASVDEIMRKFSDEINEKLDDNLNSEAQQESLQEAAEKSESSDKENSKVKSNEDFQEDSNNDAIDEIYDELVDDLKKLSETRQQLSENDNRDTRNDDTEEKNAGDALDAGDISQFDALLSSNEESVKPQHNIDNEPEDDLQKIMETRQKLIKSEDNDKKNDNKNDEPKEMNADDAFRHEEMAHFDALFGPYEESLVPKERHTENEDVNDNEGAAAENINQLMNNDLVKEEPLDENGNIDVADIGDQSNIDDALEDDDDESSKNKSMETIISGEIKESVALPIPYIKDSISPGEGQDEPEQSLEKSKILNDQPIKTMDVSEISPEQYEQVMQQFKIIHEEELESESTVENDSINLITLDLDKAVVVTSPNYPEPYPTNVTIDWLFEGSGVGIELNITDFAVNGALGDYLLVKPGGNDASGTDGLVFSYRLQSTRKYRFWDVDRLFVRFVARPGMSFLKGFQFSVRMLAPLIPYEEPVPEPEPLIPEPKETLTVYLGIANLTAFRQMKEDFRLLLADMATMYINSNKIDPGLNTTYEATQITSIGVCNINWPGVHRCAELTFAVPLLYEDTEEEDGNRLSVKELTDMWNTYSVMDPFASRLRLLQVTEFMAPRDDSVLMVWVLISLGVIFSTVVLAAMLWRYSCFENYTRLVSASETGSEYSRKSAPALYPTPHQALPPLPLHGYDSYDAYDAADYMGGFTNKSFRRDELFDIESDEETIPTRNTKMNSRDVSDV
ncbi:hypothetical protein ACJJTC_007389 [Scirpophaga incertulas]